MATSSSTRGKSRPNPRQSKDVQQPTPFLRRRSTRLIGIALAVMLVGGIAGVVYLSRGPEVVTAEQAVDEFRAAPKQKTEAAAETRTAPETRTNPAGPQAQAQPEQATAPTGYGPLIEGVYVFATDGYEETDALSGQRHTYPNETTMTIRKGGCGWIARWEPLRERWEETEMCEKDEGTSMGRYTMYHEFFQRGVREDFACPGSFVQKPTSKATDMWTFNCTSKQSKVDAKVTVVGIENLNIGGRTVKTTRYRYDIKVSGDNNGTLVQERWLSSNPRVMARLTQDADLKVSSPFGPVNYKEKFRIDLKSVDPRT